MELTEWRAYSQIEPFGDMVADRRHGIATAVLANVNRDPKSVPEAYRATDFIPWHPANAEPTSSDGEFHDDPERQSRVIKAALFKNVVATGV